MPKVSVIIPTYNRANFIARAISSVLNQTFQDFEIIVIDDGSKDNTKETVEPFKDKIIYIFQENQGISATRNHGIQKACGEYIAFLDSDDFWTNEKLQEQVKILELNKHVGIVYCRMPIVNEKGEQVGLKPAGISGRNLKELLTIWGDLPTSSVMTRKECFNKAGLFDTSLTISEDTEMWMRIAQYYDLFEIEGKVLAYYFRHSGQITSNPIAVYQGQIKTDLKILSYFKDAPKEFLTKRIALNEYMTGRKYYSLQNYKKSFFHVSSALSCYPFFGPLLYKKNEKLIIKLYKSIKPYGLYFASLIKSLLQK